ncbi:hypothetical protein THRCLA_09208 [Thraustotheca clavata]|uniref:WRKY transcription factor 19 n=1 Tax=Thraustotheca clavata TaxID=74557 RepID=A0A1V9YY90_9STRA|nr:hypothetical protein THRCLA_09208 [Thraustotheca clavata]
MKVCLFKDCLLPPRNGSDKCSFHKRRKQCLATDCTNQVYARGLCVRHGGKKVCDYPNCENTVYGGAFCSEHGGQDSKRFCIVQGCNRQARTQRRCVRHGGGRKCGIADCHHHARVSGFCHSHCRPLSIDVNEGRKGSIDDTVLPISWSSDSDSSSPSLLPLSPRSWNFVLDVVSESGSYSA